MVYLISKKVLICKRIIIVFNYFIIITYIRFWKPYNRRPSIYNLEAVIYFLLNIISKIPLTFKM